MATTFLHLDVNACRLYDHLDRWPQPVPAHRTAPGGFHHGLLIGAGPPDFLSWKDNLSQSLTHFSHYHQALRLPELLLLHVEGVAWAQETRRGRGPVERSRHRN